MGISKQAVGQLVKELEAMGMVGRVPDPEDGRAHLVTFTETGRLWLVKGLGVLKEVEGEVLSWLGCDQVEQLKRLLQTIVHHLERE